MVPRASARSRPADWDWSFAEDGNLALDRHDLWEEIPSAPTLASVTKSGRGRTLCSHARRPLRVRAMSPRASGHARRPGRAQRRAAHRLRRFAGLTAVVAVGVVTLLVTAFGPGAAETRRDVARPAPADRLLPAGPPSRTSSRRRARCGSSCRSRRTASRRSATTPPATARSRSSPSAAAATQGLLRDGSSTASSAAATEPDLVPAARRHAARARRRSRSAPRRAPTSTRRSTGRSSGSPTTCLERPDVRRAHRHPAARRAVARRLGHAPRAPTRRSPSARPSRRAQPKIGDGRRPLARRAAGARALHAGRGQPRLGRGRPGRPRSAAALRILFVADVVGAPGPAGRRGAAAARCARSSASTSASSTARTPPTASGSRRSSPTKLLAAGADVITLGNHTWRRPRDRPYLDRLRAA